MNSQMVTSEEINKIREEYYSNMNAFEKRFYFNLELLVDRINRFKETKINTIDYWTYYDAILSQIRALCMESPHLRNNHTLQIYLKSIGEDAIANKIDDYFQQEIIEGVTLKEAIKMSVDKFIAHYDKVDERSIVIEHICRVKLTNENEKFYMGNIIKDLLISALRACAQAMVRNCDFHSATGLNWD